MRTSTVLDALRDMLGDGILVTDPDIVAAHSRDRAPLCEAGKALVLARPRTTDDVATIVRYAAEHAVPVVPQGTRTGLAGAANAVDGAILLSTARMNKVVEIDVPNQVAVVQPGITNAEFSRAVADAGLFYPPDPSSWEESTIGGNVATNAGGLCCVKYGVTSDYVRGLELVTGAGEVLRTGRRTVKGVAGLDLTSLAVGSEGTLGVVTEVTLALRPAPPHGTTAAGVFPTPAAALSAAEQIMSSGLRPSMLEYMDGTALTIIQGYQDLGFAGAGGLLIMESDAAQCSDEIAAMRTICETGGASEVVVAGTVDEAKLLHQARRLSLPAMERRGNVLVEDVAVPRTRLLEFRDGIETIGVAHDVEVSLAGHVGDGNVHPGILYQADDIDEERRALAAFEDIMDLGRALGGTVTGEHGIGLLKRNALAAELGPVSESLQRQIKTVFDPSGVMNPGKVFSC